MLLSRRQFLSLSGATALIATCSPQAMLGQSLFNRPQQASSAILEGMQGLPQQKNMIGVSDQYDYPTRGIFRLAPGAICCWSGSV
ncbi:MAG: twin-arginine translocation signal domain-containing protein [Nitrosomonas communis]|nr:twin-arginine translocation signal domain-containing protein [Nitrosomonas communis]